MYISNKLRALFYNNVLEAVDFSGSVIPPAAAIRYSRSTKQGISADTVANGEERVICLGAAANLRQACRIK